MHNTTKPERGSLLSAHLDGELSPEERQEAEAALASNPAAADEFRSLAGVHDLIAGLSRPTGPDLVPGVMDRLRNRKFEPRDRRSTAWRLQVGALVGGVAASVAFFVLFRESPRPPRPDLSGLASSATAPVLDPARAPAGAEIVGPPAPARPESPNGETLVGPPAELALAERPVEETPAAGPAGLSIPGLGADSEPLVFSITEPEGAATREQVALLLGLSTHRDFHQIELPPADAENEAAKAAVVFAATLDPKELATFRDRLATTFPEGREENGSAPTLTAELVSQSRVSTLPANPAGEVSFPQTKLAMQFRTGERRNSPAPSGDADQTDDAPNPDPNAGAPKAKTDRPPAGTADPAGGDQPRSILVWLIRAPKD